MYGWLTICEERKFQLRIQEFVTIFQFASVDNSNNGTVNKEVYLSIFLNVRKYINALKYGE